MALSPLKYNIMARLLKRNTYRQKLQYSIKKPIGKWDKWSAVNFKMGMNLYLEFSKIANQLN